MLAAAFHVLAASAALAGGSKDEDDEDDGPSPPNVYLDLYTSFATVPGNTLFLGFRNIAELTTSSSRNINVMAPMSVDVNDHLTLMAGVNLSTTSTAATGWQDVAVNAVFAGFSADVLLQTGWLPKVTVQSYLARSVDTGTLGVDSTTSTTVVEMDYALDKDETRGFLGGIKYTNIQVDTRLANVGASLIGYAGGYYQWPNNWKVSGRFGVQSFDGASLLNKVHLQSFTQPIMRLDLQRMDDDDNKLFGVSFEVVWAPKPVYQLTLNTPLYLHRE
ncbi:MAG: hypothetical protein EKK40_00845 [Bradyrhizobiaceae bacterium]|nr:MAG: hypothetical protein EKK40_00845 [Bradyrhizobiaceae bacterium]